MKNSLIFILIINIFFFGAACADEIVIKANLIQTKELGNIVIGIGNAEAKTNEGFEIYANKFTLSTLPPSAPKCGASIQSPTLKRLFELICILETKDKIVSLNTNIKTAVNAPIPLKR